jgi:hypothetical protein
LSDTWLITCRWMRHRVRRCGCGRGPRVNGLPRWRQARPGRLKAAFGEKFPKLKVTAVVNFSKNHDARIDKAVDECIVVADVVHLQPFDDFRRWKRFGANVWSSGLVTVGMIATSTCVAGMPVAGATEAARPPGVTLLAAR